MVLSGDFKFMGVDKRSGFKDPSKVFYVLGLGQGLDALRIYIDAEQYGRYSSIEPYSDVSAELDYNPVSGRVNLINLV